MTFGETVQKLRYDLGLTQAQLALALRRSTQTLSNWEKGRNTPWPRAQHHVLEKIKSLLSERAAAKVEPPMDLVSRRVDLGRFD